MRPFEEVPFLTTPSAPLKEASRLLLDVASTQLRLRPIGFALGALLCQEGSGAPNSFVITRAGSDGRRSYPILQMALQLIQFFIESILAGNHQPHKDEDDSEGQSVGGKREL